MTQLICNNNDKLINIMKHINKLKNDDDIIDYLYNNYNNNINIIFNKSDEQIQIDFIKNLLININSKHYFKTLFPLLKIQNIYIIKTLLDWGIKYTDYSLCYFVLNHKASNIVITEDEYNNYEQKTNNKDIALLFSQIRMKEIYNNDNSDNSDSESIISSDEDFFESFNDIESNNSDSDSDNIEDVD